MKKIISFLLILITMPFYAQWVQQNSLTLANWNDVYCITEDFVVVVGSNGTILKTTDGGENWVQKNSGTTFNLTKVQFVNANVGYISANTNTSGLLLKTTDGGENWNSVTAAGTSFINDFSRVNENIIFIINDDGVLKKTSNGGQSFEKVNTNDFIEKIQFINEQIGYASNGSFSFVKTIDGGSSWSVIGSLGAFPANGAFFFLNEQVGFVNTTKNLSKTTDGGLNFTYLDTIEYAMNKLFATSENIIWGITLELTLSGQTDYTMRGEIIEPGDFQRINGVPYFRSIYFANETIGYAVDFDGHIFKNTTGTMLSLNHSNDKSTFLIYPNPTSDQITISFKEEQSEPFSIKIVDCLGKEIFSENYTERNFVTLDTKYFSKGIYALSYTSRERKQTQKIIIK